MLHHPRLWTGDHLVLKPLHQRRATRFWLPGHHHGNEQFAVASFLSAFLSRHGILHHSQTTFSAIVKCDVSYPSVLMPIQCRWKTPRHFHQDAKEPTVMAPSTMKMKTMALLSRPDDKDSDSSLNLFVTLQQLWISTQEEPQALPLCHRLAWPKTRYRHGLY